MNNRSPNSLQPDAWSGQISLSLKTCILLGFMTLSAACSTADPLATPPLAAAQPETTPDSPFTPIPATEQQNPPPTPASTPTETTDTELQGTQLPTLPVGEPAPDPDPVNTEAPVVTVVSRASCAASQSDMQQRMLQLINEARAAERLCGSEDYAATRALQWNSDLEAAARGHSQDMATHNFFAHTGSDGRSASMRVTSEGYRWRNVGENIAAGRETAAETLQDWLESPGHCRNIMNPSFTEVAVACVEGNDTDYRSYWTNVLAAPR